MLAGLETGQETVGPHDKSLCLVPRSMERANRSLAKRSVPTPLPLPGLGQGLPASADKERDSSVCLSGELARSRCLHQARPTVASLETGTLLSVLLAELRSVILPGRVAL